MARHARWPSANFAIAPAVMPARGPSPPEPPRTRYRLAQLGCRASRGLSLSAAPRLVVTVCVKLTGRIRGRSTPPYLSDGFGFRGMRDRLTAGRVALAATLAQRAPVDPWRSGIGRRAGPGALARSRGHWRKRGGWDAGVMRRKRGLSGSLVDISRRDGGRVRGSWSRAGAPGRPRRPRARRPWSSAPAAAAGSGDAAVPF